MAYRSDTIKLLFEKINQIFIDIDLFDDGLLAFESVSTRHLLAYRDDCYGHHQDGDRLKPILTIILPQKSLFW